MYGTAHSVKIGMIWLYWAASIALWLPIFILTMYQDRPLINSQLNIDKKWLWAWVLAPLLFFTFSRNIIWTYTLTALPAFALLVAKSWPNLRNRHQQIMQLMIALWMCLLILLVFVWLPRQSEQKSARLLVHEASSHYPHLPLYSFEGHTFSASYYTQGQVRFIQDQTMLQDVLHVPNNLIMLSTMRAKAIELSGQGRVLSTNANRALVITK